MFLTPFIPKRTEMALSVPTKSFLEPSSDAAMPEMTKDIARNDIMKLKVS